jgi:hypothetical protein
MPRIVSRTLGGLLASIAVAAVTTADPSLHLNAFALKPGGTEAQEIAAADALMASAVGKAAPGRVTLYRTIAAGSDPATHTYAISNPSVAQGEAFDTKLYADAAWASYVRAFEAHATPVSSTRFRTVRSWGDVNDTDAVWTVVLLRITDVPKFLAARARFEATETGKKFPGQWHLNAVVAGGVSPVTHQVAAGFASEAEADAWSAAQRANSDWQTYLNETRDISQTVGFSMHRVVKAWGKPLAEALGR